MADEEPPLEREAPSHCPKCDGLPRLLFTLPDSNNNRVVRLYRCIQCDALIWME